MKSELKAKFLQHLLSKKKENEGFTLIELLVVIIIIGILAAIALPTFLNQANKARQSESSMFVGALNRAHQAYYTENRTFTSDFATLDVGIPTQTKDYTYASTVTAIDAISTGDPIKTDLKGIAGRVFVTTDSGGNATAKAFVCLAATGDGSVPDVSKMTDVSGCP